ncbi:hypothetical protein [Streptomyces sp. NPDC047061]|uniref:hypothetical protein n=1 Tax=Streptomyces sp. NPDC047061 TaxID=3154605 RepID=UPI0033E9C5FE
MGQALAAAFGERRRAMRELADTAPSTGAHSARTTYIETYLSELHRDAPAFGCAAAALVGDAARAEPGAPIRAAFTEGLQDLVEAFQQLSTTSNDGEADRTAALAELSTLVGALLLARACDDAVLSRSILDAALQYVTDRSADTGD